MTTTQSEITEERLREMLAGLDGVTPGPWSAHEKGIHPHLYVCGPSRDMEFGEDKPVVAYVIQTDDRDHIARCDPETMRQVLTLALEALTRRSSAGVVVTDEFVDRLVVQLWRYREIDIDKGGLRMALADALRLSPQEPVTGEAVAWRAAAKQAIDDWDRQVCIHETVHRGGSIWTICDDCGRKWADDRGGFIPYSDPAGIAHLRALLDAPAPSPLPAAEGEIVVSATSILAIRDALAADDTNEAWHQLYAIADPAFCEMEPWRNLEHKAALASPSTGVNDAMVERALAAFNEAINNPQMVPCDRCDGKGYHHGFGEDGASPDWCEKCGGNQYDVVPGEESRAMRAALLAAHGEK